MSSMYGEGVVAAENADYGAMPIYAYIIIDGVNEGQPLMTASVKCGWGIQKN